MFLNQKGKTNIFFALILTIILFSTPAIIGAAMANTTYKIESNETQVPQQISDLLSSQMITFIKKDTSLRHLKLHDLKVRLVSQDLKDNTIEAVFDIERITTLNYNKAEDV